MMECPPFKGLWNDCAFASSSVPPIDGTGLETAFGWVLVGVLFLLAVVLGWFIYSQTAGSDRR